MLSAAATAMLAFASPAGAATLNQTTSNSITSGNSVACQETSTGFSKENSYYRRFELDEHGITSSFTVSNVMFGIEQADDGGGLGQPLTVRLFGIDAAAPFTVANLTPLGSRDITVQDSETGMVRTVPVSGTVSDPGATDLVVDVHTPNGVAGGHKFLIGSNTGGETHPSYIRAPDCDFAEPATTANAGAPSMRIVLFVDGNEPQPTAPPSPPQPSNPGGGSVGGGGSSLAFGSRTLVTVKLAAGQIQTEGSLKVRVANANGFQVTGKLSGETVNRISVARKRRIKLNAKAFSVPARGEKTVKLKLPKALQRLLKRKRRVKLRLTATVKDPAGHTRIVKKQITAKL